VRQRRAVFTLFSIYVDIFTIKFFIWWTHQGETGCSEDVWCTEFTFS